MYSENQNANFLHIQQNVKYFPKIFQRLFLSIIHSLSAKFKEYNIFFTKPKLTIVFLQTWSLEFRIRQFNYEGRIFEFVKFKMVDRIWRTRY